MIKTVANSTDWEKQIADLDARIAELEGQITEATRNTETTEAFAEPAEH